MKKKPAPVNKPDAAPPVQTLKAAPKTPGSKPPLSRKDFRENPVVEKLYKTVQEYDLREEAYKTALQMYINLKK